MVLLNKISSDVFFFQLFSIHELKITDAAQKKTPNKKKWLLILSCNITFQTEMTLITFVCVFSKCILVENKISLNCK